MQKLIKHFRRLAPGVWVCVEPADLNLPQGRIQVSPGTQLTLGKRFMNVEIAAMLEAEHRRHHRR